MHYLQWTPEYSVGNEKIDRQHQLLFQHVNDFHDALEVGVDHAALVRIFDRVMAYTQFHFQDEESLMADCGYADLARHKLLHQGLVETVLELQEALHAEEKDAGQRIAIFLRNWLRAHVLGIDKKYQPFLHQD